MQTRGEFPLVYPTHQHVGREQYDAGVGERLDENAEIEGHSCSFRVPCGAERSAERLGVLIWRVIVEPATEAGRRPSTCLGEWEKAKAAGGVRSAACGSVTSHAKRTVRGVEGERRRILLGPEMKGA
jgi:hypothetical protein